MNPQLINILNQLKAACAKLLVILQGMKEPEPAEQKPPQEPQEQPTPATTPTISMLTQFCIAIRDYEGAPGDANYRNNNPGNCRYNEGGYLPIYEPVKRSPDGFAIFPSYALGFLYLKNMIREKVMNHPTQTILEFMSAYAPYSDGNDPARYAAYIASRLAVDVSFPMLKIIT